MSDTSLEADSIGGHLKARTRPPSAPFALVEQAAGVATLLSATPAFKAALGFGRSAVDGRPLRDLFADEDARRLGALIDRCLASGKPRRAKWSGQDPRVRHMTAYPVDEGGPTAQVVLAIETLARSRDLSVDDVRLMDQLGPLGSGLLYVYDVEHLCTRYMHRDLAELIGLPEERASLESIEARLHPDDLPVFRRHIAEMRELKNDEVAQATVRVRGRNGEWRQLQSRCRVFVRGGGGAVRRVIGVASDMTHSSAQAQALAETRSALMNAEAMERRRLGRELHDSTAQHLVAVDLSLSALERRLTLDERDCAILRDIRNSLSAAHREIRTFSFVLHPPREGVGPLDERLRAFADGFGRRASLNISVEVLGVARPLSSPIEIATFRIFQEALMNVHRHAGARRVEARIGYRSDQILLEIEDDGIGFSSPGSYRTGVGIDSMRARAAQLGGRLELLKGKAGLLVRARLPLAAAALPPSRPDEMFPRETRSFEPRIAPRLTRYGLLQ